MSTIIDIADAVVTELNSPGAPGFSQTFQAQRYYRPVFDLAEMKDLHVTVMPKGVEMSMAGRSLVQSDVQIDIGVQKKLSADSTGDIAEIDALMGLVQEIIDFLRCRRLSALPAAAWVRTENSPIFAPEHLEQLRQFTSVITLTYRVIG
jgi:hypothetical protein